MVLNSFVLGRKESYLVKQVLKPQQSANAFIKRVFVANHDSEPKDGLNGTRYPILPYETE